MNELQMQIVDQTPDRLVSGRDDATSCWRLWPGQSHVRFREDAPANLTTEMGAKQPRPDVAESCRSALERPTQRSGRCNVVRLARLPGFAENLDGFGDRSGDQRAVRRRAKQAAPPRGSRWRQPRAGTAACASLSAQFQRWSI